MVKSLLRRELLLVFVPLLALSCMSARTAVPIAPSPVVAPAPTAAVDPIPIIQLHGTPADLGTQQGTALHDEIVQLHDQYLMKFISNQRVGAMGAATLFETTLPAEYREEIHALAAATGLPEQDVMLGQCFLDLLPATACSIVTLPGAASSDGIPRMGRNLDFYSLGVADKHSVLLVYHPDGANAFVAISWPGMIGVLSGMNEYGLCVANAEVARPMRWPVAMPYTLLYRTLLERCRTVEEAVSLLQRTPRQSANNLMLMDASGDRAVAEITPESVHIRRTAATQPLVCTNHQSPADASVGSLRRSKTLEEETDQSFGQDSLASVEASLNDVAQGDFTLQSMVFEPTLRLMYLSVGKHATTRPYVEYDLGRLMSER